ncbi:MAG: GNAT family N-acetyltransferase, partial [Sphingobacteriaceae bacterium]
VIAGFASITADGYLDVLFVHKDFQRRGVALSLLNQIKKVAHTPGINRITSDVSITARPFFEKQGFSIVAAQQVALNGVVFDNFKMEILI